MSEIMTPPTKIVVGDVEYEAFHDGHSHADIVRWLMGSRSDAEEVRILLGEALGDG